MLTACYSIWDFRPTRGNKCAAFEISGCHPDTAHLVPKRTRCWGQALSRSYGCFFAEFLGDHSLVRLCLLDLITCVGLRYGFYTFKFRDFSWKRALYYYPMPKHK